MVDRMQPQTRHW